MTLTTEQRDALIKKIASSLMDAGNTDGGGMGDYSNCYDAAEAIVSDWEDELETPKNNNF